VIVHEHLFKTKTPGTYGQIRKEASGAVGEINKDQTDVAVGGENGAVADGGNAAPLAHCRESLTAFF